MLQSSHSPKQQKHEEEVSSMNETLEREVVWFRSSDTKERRKLTTAPTAAFLSELPG